MKRAEIITTYRKQIEQEMVTCYRAVLESNGRIQYGIYIWEDGEIELLEGAQGDNTWLQAKDWETRKLFPVITIASPYFNAFDFTDDPEPEDDSEKETARQQIVDYLVDEYEREGASDALDAVLSEAEWEDE